MAFFDGLVSLDGVCGTRSKWTTIDYDNLVEVIQNKNTDNYSYSFLINTIKRRVNDEVINGLDGKGIHMIKSDNLGVRDKMVNIYVNKMRNIEIEKVISEQIIYKISKECQEDNVVVFYDFLEDISVYINPTYDLYRNDNVSMGVICTYDIISKDHYSVTPPKSMVKMLINEEWEIGKRR